MKFNINELKNKLGVAIFPLLVLITIAQLFSQIKNASKPKEFSIAIEKTDSGIKMKSHQGSAWKELSFSLDDYVPQAVDEYGMTTLGEVSPYLDKDLTNYLFTIMKTKEGIRLIGLEGTAWKELSFSLTDNESQTIDQFGMK